MTTINCLFEIVHQQQQQHQCLKELKSYIINNNNNNNINDNTKRIWNQKRKPPPPSLEVVRYIILGFAAKEWSSLPKKLYGGCLEVVRYIRNALGLV